jgi:type IV pilus assembly protein PilM
MEQGSTPLAGPLLTVAEVAEVLRVSNMTVYRLIKAGDLPALRVGKNYRIREADLPPSSPRVPWPPTKRTAEQVASSAIGVDIGSRTIAVAEVKAGRGTTSVTNFGGVELPDDVVREGEILDVAAVAEALRELLDTAKLTSKRVWLGVSNQRVVVRQVDLPAMEEKELRASLRYQVQEYIPIPVEEAELDVHVVSNYTAEDGAEMQRLLLVAGHRDMITAQVDAATRPGSSPIGVDLNPFAVLRAMGDDSTFGQGNQVLVDAGAGVTNIVVHEQGIPTFVRILVMGGDQITDALAAGMSVSREEAEAAKRAAPSATPATSSAASSPSRPTPSSTRSAARWTTTRPRPAAPGCRGGADRGGVAADRPERAAG